MKNITKALTFDDVSVVPALSRLESRDDVDLSVDLSGISLEIPILSAPMDTVTGVDMACFMGAVGGIGILHRYLSIKSQVENVNYVREQGYKVGAAIGVNGDSRDRAKALVDAGADLLVLDIAHGHTVAALKMISFIKDKFPAITVMSGNICTRDAAMDCVLSGADILRVGVGGGSACTTRVVAGVGVPQISAILEVEDVPQYADHHVTIVADGGIRNSGDAVKAFAAGADAVMLGGFLAPFPVSAGDVVLQNTGEPSGLEKVIKGWVNTDGADAAKIMSTPANIDFGDRWVKKKRFRGMASDSALSEYKKDEDYVVEGEQFLIDIDHDFEKTFQTLLDGIRLGLSYVGADCIDDLKYAELVEITPHGAIEATPHKGGDSYD